MAKILLVQPTLNLRNITKDKTIMPTNLIMLGTAIEDNHQVKIYDRNVNLGDSAFFDYLRDYKPDIIGFSAMTSERLFDIIYLGPKIKQMFPKIIIVVGGPHATLEPDSLLNELYVDYIVRGEGEEAFLEFCNTFDKNPSKIGKLRNINKNPIRPFMNVNDIKIPNYSLVDLSKYSEPDIFTSRGCYGRCTFCTSTRLWGKDGEPCTRFYNLENLKKLFKYVIEECNLEDFQIADDTFVNNRKRCLEVCKFLYDNYKGKISFFVKTRADSLDDEVLTELRKAGCTTALLGSESGSQRILDYLDKRETVELQGKAIELCRKHGLFSHASFMIGIPTETVEDLNMTKTFIRKYNPDIADVNVFNVFMPGTIIYESLVKEGVIQKPKTLLEWAEIQPSSYIRAMKRTYSKIPEDIIESTYKGLWKHNYYKTKFKKIIYWIKRGKIKRVLNKLRTG